MNVYISLLQQHSSKFTESQIIEKYEESLYKY